MSDVEAEFFAHSARIPEMVALGLTEADTRYNVIDPVLRILGYREVSDIRREVSIPATKEFIDYALLVAGQPQVLVEAKALRHPITDQNAGQCVAYAAVLGVEWCLITNGKTWVVYNAHAKGPLESKKVAEVSVGGDETQTAAAWKTLSLFSRESLMQANPLTGLLVDRTVEDELRRGDSAAVTALRKAVRDRFGVTVPPQAILGSIRRLAGELPLASTVPAAGSPVQLLSTSPRSPGMRPSTAAPGPGRTTLADLIARGVIQEEDRVEARIYGVTHVGRVRDGGIEVQGTLYATPSAAASALRDGKASNGWVVWTFHGRPLGELRAGLLKPDGQISDGPTSGAD